MYRIVRDSKHNDKFRNRTNYDPADYIDTETLVNLQQAQQNKCNWCGVFTQSVLIAVIQPSRVYDR